MFSFFKKKKVTPDLSGVGVDMHSHLLPGLDDGLKDLETTISFVRELHELGYSKLICTPHIFAELYPNKPETILPKLDLVRSAVKKNDIPVTIEAAAEYMIDTDMEELVNSGRPLLTFGKNYILVEMSYIAPSPNFEQMLFSLRVKGYQPILAHPERYMFYHANFEKYERAVDLGCLLQVNLLSLIGYYGKPVKTIAEKLFEKNMVSLVGTDMHHANHMEALKALSTTPEFYRTIENANLLNKSLL
ncbi:MAG TPA: CpsB/CapC family capsule biosynthesis tyrosine phosphatase [Chitinophagaceae bacterium]|nr:CpsB/CapC family capsule biosynthesis tyrosine phosphatase [Chitinophagaceae bacterium]